jgi:pimeloyl-ACP methyl ester carboxylesterase
LTRCPAMTGLAASPRLPVARVLLLALGLATLLAAAPAVAQRLEEGADGRLKIVPEDSLAREQDELPAEGEAPRWIEGRGENELVLIHGLGANRSIWDEVRPYLVNTFQLHEYELHGHGHTPPLPDATIETEAAALRAWIQAEGLVYPSLVGHGLGGMVAMQYAFEHPRDVQRLVVIDTAPRQLAAPELKSKVADALLADYDRFVASRYLDISNDEEINRRAVDMALRTDSATFASLLLSSFDWDLTDELPRQSVPMLVVGSEFFLPQEGYERAFLEQYGYGQARVLSFKRLAHTGHYCMLEKPALLASVIMVYITQEELPAPE